MTKFVMIITYISSISPAAQHGCNLSDSHLENTHPDTGHHDRIFVQVSIVPPETFWKNSITFKIKGLASVTSKNFYSCGQEVKVVTNSLFTVSLCISHLMRSNQHFIQCHKVTSIYSNRFMTSSVEIKLATFDYLKHDLYFQISRVSTETYHAAGVGIPSPVHETYG